MKFAHTADIHIGSYENSPKLSKLEENAFYSMMDQCIENNVDFIVIAGDLFDSARPDLSIVDRIVKKMKQIREKDIIIYVVYGSHDYNPGGKSIIDILVSTGLIVNLFNEKKIDGKLKLEFTIDNKTGIRLVGVPGKRSGLENEYYKNLDREYLEKEEGIKIFVFHSGLDELIDIKNDSEHISIKSLPKGFDYYAGGHLHNKFDPYKYEEYGTIAFPGIPFSIRSKDLKNDTRGFYLVNIDEDKSIKTEFIPIRVFKHENYDYEINDKITLQQVKNKISLLDVEGKAITLNIKGLEKNITRKEIDNIENMLMNKGTINVNINTYKDINIFNNLEEKIEREDINRETIEKNIFKKELSIDFKNPELIADSGVNLAIDLLRCIGQDRSDKKGKDTLRVIEEGKKVLKLENYLK